EHSTLDERRLDVRHRIADADGRIAHDTNRHVRGKQRLQILRHPAHAIDHLDRVLPLRLDDVYGKRALAVHQRDVFLFLLAVLDLGDGTQRHGLAAAARDNKVAEILRPGEARAQLDDLFLAGGDDRAGRYFLVLALQGLDHLVGADL